MGWISYSLIGAICLAIHMLSMTKLSKMGLQSSFINMIVFTVATSCLWIYHFTVKKENILQMNHYGWFGLASLSVFAVIVTTLEALKRAPNPGFVNAIENMSTVIVTLGSVMLLSSELTLFKFLGVICVFIGVSIITIG